MDKHICFIQKGQSLINGDIVRVLCSDETISDHELVEIKVVKGEMPMFVKGDKKYVGSRISTNDYATILCLVN